MRRAEWFESTGGTRRAVRHFLAARHAGRALDLMQDQVVTVFFRDPEVRAPSDLSHGRPFAAR